MVHLQGLPVVTACEAAGLHLHGDAPLGDGRRKGSDQLVGLVGGASGNEAAPTGICFVEITSSRQSVASRSHHCPSLQLTH